MAINPYHIVEELDGVRCSIIEKGIPSERAAFITEILEASNQNVVTTIDSEGKRTVGVTDITFNVVYALYGRRLKSRTGKLVTPSYWTREKENDGFYWENRR